MQLYIVNISDNRVRLVGADGNISTLIRSATGATPSSLGFRSRIRPTTEGEILLSDLNRIFRWDNSVFASLLLNNTAISSLEDLIINPQGELLVAGRARVLRVGPSTPGTSGEAPQVAGGTGKLYFSGDHGLATAAKFGNGDPSLALRSGDIANSAGIGGVT